jgi:D-3-phosphoglycerate dehydrogenase
MSQFKIDEEFINAGKKLKCICTASTGTNHIDIKYANKKNIHIISLKKYKRILEKIPSTAELAFTLMMASIRNIIPASNSVEKYQWSYLEFIGEQLKEKKIGVLGYGRLGRLFANFCLKFGAKVYFYDPFKKNISKKIKKVSNLKSFLKSIDILSIHIHLNESTKNFLNKSLLRHLKKNILIINTSRGEIINEDDLIKFLKKNQKSKFAADVISHELGNIFKSKLIKYFKKNKNRVLLTPHLGGSTYQAQEMAYFSSLENLIDFDSKVK